MVFGFMANFLAGIVFSLVIILLVPSPAAVEAGGCLKQPAAIDKGELITRDTSFTVKYDSTSYTVGLQFTDLNYNRITLDVRIGDSLVSSTDWPFSHPVFRIFMADADNNGRPDICVGVVKKTRFDPVVRRRPFFFKTRNGFIRPLWLGTTLGGELIDFKPKILGNKTYITAMMKMKTKYIVADYSWKGFGFRMDSLIGSYKDYSTTYNKFTER